VQQELGELEQARAHMQRSVRIFERFLGTDHDDTAQARALLATVGNQADDAAQAQPRRSRRPWRASIDARATRATGKLWPATFGSSSSANVGGIRPRRVRQTMTWTRRASLHGFRRRFCPDDAYEHDYKLVNTSNPGFPWMHPFRFGGTASFWATRRGLTWGTNFPIGIGTVALATLFAGPAIDLILLALAIAAAIWSRLRHLSVTSPRA
jgi:hypothetical protein